jgi:hypothetical protein
MGDRSVDEGIWLVTFMHYDLGYFDLEQKTLQTLDNPFGTRLFHDRDILVTACGRICLYRKKINISSVLAGQRLGIKFRSGRP